MRLIAVDGVLYDEVGQLCAIEHLPPGVTDLNKVRLGLGGNKVLLHCEKAKSKVTKIYPKAEVWTLGGL